jgi:formylglycine-generating enzyme required for sulfatase activity/alpha-beta hydrolase superfamily lysophospholipase
MRRIPVLIIMAVIGLAAVPAAAETPEGMALIPGGEYRIGAATERGDHPPHQVTLASYYIDTHEVTCAQYMRFCRETDRPFPFFWEKEGFRVGPDFPDHPVLGVNWGDAQAYAKWAGKRLLTEAEWEVAARGGEEDLKYPWGDEIDESRANYGKKKDGSMPVGSYKPNGFGLFDMTGNALEWVQDRYDMDYYRDGPTQNPIGGLRGYLRVIRGGGWFTGPSCSRVHWRNALKSNFSDFNVGFRCAQDLPGQRGVEFEADDGLLLRGDLHLPTGDRRAPTVILFHQAGSNARGEYGAILPRLTAAGYNVLAVDQRSGGSRFGSENRTVAALPEDQKELGYCEAWPDLVAALRYAAILDLGEKRFVWGSSYSAGLVVKLGAEHGDLLDGVLAFSPAAGGPMADCDPSEFISQLAVPTLALRPGSEMEYESVVEQLAAFEAAGHETYVSKDGVHGSSMLDASRTGKDVEATWRVVLDFLDRVVKADE